jgi:hypothetical protein
MVFGRALTFPRLADCQSAIQQTISLRYEDSAALPQHHPQSSACVAPNPAMREKADIIAFETKV